MPKKIFKIMQAFKIWDEQQMTTSYSWLSAAYLEYQKLRFLSRSESCFKEIHTRNLKKLARFLWLLLWLNLATALFQRPKMIVNWFVYKHSTLSKWLSIINLFTKKAIAGRCQNPNQGISTTVIYCLSLKIIHDSSKKVIVRQNLPLK